MSAMSFREPNEVLWYGVRPAHKGTQVLKSGVAVNNEVTVYTVSAGKTLYLTFFSWHGSTQAAGQSVDFYLYDSGDVRQVRLAGGYLEANLVTSIAVGLQYPIEIPSGWYFTVSAAGVDIRSYGCIHGWEE